MDVFLENMNKVIDFSNSLRQKIQYKRKMTKKRKYKAETICYLCVDKFNGNVKKFYNVKDIVTIQKSIKELPIQYVI